LADSSETLVTETQQGIAAHDLVGYDRVSNKFLLPDAGELAYKEFQSKGWSGSTTTLPHVARSEKQMAANRHVYHADNPAQFSVCGEEYENGDWKPHETEVGRRSSRKDVRESFRTPYRDRKMNPASEIAIDSPNHRQSRSPC
jgi:hypothetical protein